MCILQAESMKNNLQTVLKQILADLGITDVTPTVEHTTNLIHGDYTTNIPLQLAKHLKKKPLEIAEDLVEKITKQAKPQILKSFAKIEVAAPGFINFHLSPVAFSSTLESVLIKKDAYGKSQNKKGQKIMVEFAHPNTHKAFHIGHLRNITTGESIVRLLESQGAHVIRANYQGDVGMHIAKCLYGIQHETPSFDLNKFQTHWHNKPIHEKVEFLGKAYAAGSKAFEESDEVKKAVGTINKQIYAKDQAIYKLYQETRQWSLDYFASIYKRVDSHFDRFYFESETYEIGKKNVLAGLQKGVFVESDGAIIFPGKKYGLHNRVFITGEGNATYEGKEVGLGPLQFREYHPDLIIHVVGPEQAGYFKVVFAALAQLFPDTKDKEFHLIYGWVKLKQGKMSSRLGNVVLGETLIDAAKKEIKGLLDTQKYTQEEIEEITEKTAVAAVKYSFLKVSTLSEIAFDLEEATNINGDSGPYLQYTYARAQSVLRKANTVKEKNEKVDIINCNPEEKNILRLLNRFPDIITHATELYSPNTLCMYLYDLSSAYNTFYNQHPILNNPHSALRLQLTTATAQVIENGLYLLGIPLLQRM